MLVSEDANVQQNTAVRVNWFNVNVPTIIAVAGVGWGIATYINDLQYRVTNMEKTVAANTEAARDRFSHIDQKLDEFDSLPIRMTSAENQIIATNTRLDRLIENLTQGLDALRKDVNVLSTKVEVLTSKIDDLSPPKRAEETKFPKATIR